MGSLIGNALMALAAIAMTISLLRLRPRAVLVRVAARREYSRSNRDQN